MLAVGITISINYGDGGANWFYLLWYPGLYITLTSLMLVYNLFRYCRSLTLSAIQVLGCLLLTAVLFVIAAFYLALGALVTLGLLIVL